MQLWSEMYIMQVQKQINEGCHMVWVIVSFSTLFQGVYLYPDTTKRKLSLYALWKVDHKYFDGFGIV